jgi:glucose-6-phosphate isomerase
VTEPLTPPPSGPDLGDRVDGIWRHDPTAVAGPEAPAVELSAVSDRFGWLDAPAAVAGHVDEALQFAARVRGDGITDVILLGMGGSSLCSEVLRDVPPKSGNGCRFVVLDTTDERAIRMITDSLDVEKTLFIVASKSGSTLEVTSLEAHFWSIASDKLGWNAGQHFIAITDPGTSLVDLAKRKNYRATFLNPPDIGGRYSALSLFGLIPAALIGVDLQALGTSSMKMAAACQAKGDENPGTALGSFMATNALAGRDKLTVLLAPAMTALGDWIEQLIAESTGKQGRGILPVVGEPIGAVREYGPDRAFVAVITETSGAVANAATELERAGHPVFRITTTAAELGGEFFRWEFATCVAGTLIGVNPFDEPNVAEAKKRTRSQLDTRAATGAFHIDPPFERGDGYSRRESRPNIGRTKSPSRRFVAILDFLPSDPRRAELFADLRGALRRRLGLATTHGIGPRYLHSTGQFHKGGTNSGIFVLLTAQDASATPIPGTDFTFSTLKQAQALGDFDALVANGRQVVHYHLEAPTADFSVTLERLIGKIDG